MIHAECHIMPIINDKPTLMVFKVGVINFDNDGNFISFGIYFQEINDVAMKHNLDIVQIKEILETQYKTDYDLDLDYEAFFDEKYLVLKTD